MSLGADGARPARIEGRSSLRFSVRPERYSDTYLLTVNGELDLATYEGLNDELVRAEASDAARILLDLSGVTFIDSTGIRTLLMASAANGTRLRLFPVRGQVKKALDLTGVLNRLSFTD